MTWRTWANSTPLRPPTRSLSPAGEPVAPAGSQTTKRPAPRVEIRLPISATDGYLTMVRYFLESIQQFGGPLARSAHCVVSISADIPKRDLRRECPWSESYSVDFQWLDRELFRRLSYHGTGHHRHLATSDADVVILADADLLVVDDFDSIIRRAHRQQIWMGCIAHVSPFDRMGPPNASSQTWWDRVFREAGLPLPALSEVHSGWGLMSTDERYVRCPWYCNAGFLVAPRSSVDQVATTFEEDLDNVDRVLDTWFRSQMAYTLSLSRLETRTATLPLEYNFPLHVDGEVLRRLDRNRRPGRHPEDVRLYHYLGQGEIRREDFATRQSLERLLQRRDLSPDGRHFQRRLRTVHEAIVAKRPQRRHRIAKVASKASA